MSDVDQLAPVPAGTLPFRSLRAFRWPFVGERGLRGGWRVLIFIALFIAGAELIEAWWPHSAETGELQALPLLGRESLQLLLVVAATLFLGRFERRSLGDYGLPLVLHRRIARGLVLGFAAASALLLILAGLGVMHVSALALSGAAIVSNALQWGLVFLVVALFEELLLRGYAQATLARSIGFWPAAVLLSILFALLHARNPGETPLGLIAVGCFGLFFCYTLRVTGNLWLAVGFHAAWDWAESFFYGVPDSGTHMAGHLLDTAFSGPTWLSGGSAGPEGSVLILATLAAAASVVRPRRRAMMNPQTTQIP
jgi:membrane protease YdiL (CAAX protease family)